MRRTGKQMCSSAALCSHTLRWFSVPWISQTHSIPSGFPKVFLIMQLTDQATTCWPHSPGYWAPRLPCWSKESKWKLLFYLVWEQGLVPGLMSELKRCWAHLTVESPGVTALGTQVLTTQRSVVPHCYYCLGVSAASEALSGAWSLYIYTCTHFGHSVSCWSSLWGLSRCGIFTLKCFPYLFLFHSFWGYTVSHS